MTSIFADTGYRLALFNSRDSLHLRAREFASGLEGRHIVTSELVFVEVLNGCSGAGPHMRSIAAGAIADLRRGIGAVVEPFSSSSFSEALRLYVDRMDKQWSLTDCSSFLIMQTHGIEAALTPDRHFEQAGFTALLR